ncbi:MAG: hypothetical protein GWO07_10745 [Candidatus Dadabacteria bacterium]|nr:hypothetical protein [Candidatus Dadabacteria bacterium]NIV41836.1 hypothetical protein [Candidatus Dadabacteria bacterium]NIX15767.1 hypothetical protein [Candidatus Dadabacteria bacterium]
MINDKKRPEVVAATSGHKNLNTECIVSIPFRLISKSSDLKFIGRFKSIDFLSLTGGSYVRHLL